MKVLVTGCGGFVAGVFSRTASASGHIVVGLARNAPSVGDVRQYPADSVLLARTLDEFCPDVIFHGAGTASVANSIKDPATDLEASFGTWRALLEAVRISNVRPVIIYPSSAAVYGHPAQLPVPENAASNPISPYGFHRLLCETLSREYGYCFGLNVITCRLFSVFGPEQRRLLIWDLFEQLRSARSRIQLRGTGRETRDFMSVHDAARAILLIAEAAVSDPTNVPRLINIASGEERKIADMALMMKKIVVPEADVEITFSGKITPGDPVNWGADIRALLELINDWKTAPLEDALRATVAAWDVDVKK